jgi:ubiquinone/menaquinone biosynthesis C-methylase UbiE
MDYSGDLALIQQRLAQSDDMAARRVVVLDALQAAPGERILEVGCGSGLCLRPIGVAVGEAGRAVGLDLSQDQIEAAAAPPLRGTRPDGAARQ